METWSRLIEAGRELSQAFTFLDRAGEITGVTTAAIITKEGLLTAARDSVARANAAMRRV